MRRDECSNCGYTTDVELRRLTRGTENINVDLCGVCYHTFASRGMTYPHDTDPVLVTIAWCTNRILDEIRAVRGDEASRHDPKAQL